MKISRLLNLVLIILLLPACSFGDLLGDFMGSESQVLSGDRVVIAYAEAPSTYSPLSYDSVNRKYLANIYEPLVRYDKTFNFKTGLAVSWGRLDDLTWNFRLREGVVFHDGSEFDADDVVYSLEMAMDDSESGLTSLLGSIESVEVVEDNRIQIVTSEPDPLLLHRLTNVYMLSEDYDDFNSPLGTGSYVLTALEEGDMTLGRFDSYWGDTPFFEEVVLRYIPDAEDRMAAVTDGSVQFLANVPPQNVFDLGEYRMRLAEVPSLEVSFLMLNEGGVFADENLKKAVWYAISMDYASVLGGGYLKQAHQYAATGIYGFSPNFVRREQNLVVAAEYMELYAGEKKVTLDLPTGLEALGDEVVADLAEIGVEVEVNILEGAELEEKILAGESDFYFFGWKYDLADSSDFFVSVAHSEGEFNGISYENQIVDSMIEQVITVLDESERQLMLAKLADTLAADQVIMPLFEAKSLYGLGEGVRWDIRLDGQILASEIVGNVVE